MVFQTLADLVEIEWEHRWHVATHEPVKQPTIKACQTKYQNQSKSVSAYSALPNSIEYSFPKIWCDIKQFDTIPLIILVVPSINGYLSLSPKDRDNQG